MDSPSIIRRTIIESGVREKTKAGAVLGSSAIRSMAVEHENDKRELQHLNEKFGVYLSRVRQLENQNKQLEAELDDIKKKWGFETGKVRDQYDAELQNLRAKIDDAERVKCRSEVFMKSFEYEADLLNGKIDFIYNLINDDRQKLGSLTQQREMYLSEMDALENRYRDTLLELRRYKGDLDTNLNNLNDLKNELDSCTYERIILQNVIQTLGDQLVFQRALHEEEIREFQHLAVPQFDVSQFYRSELTKAINDIRRDFETLSSVQKNEIEAYYKVRTEEMKDQVADEKRKIEEAKAFGRVEVMDLGSLKDSLKDMTDERGRLENENYSLQNTLRNIEQDIMDIRTEQERRDAQKEMELMQLNAQIQSYQDSLRSTIENNVSLRFEINTYRRLLESEEFHLTSNAGSISGVHSAAAGSMGVGVGRSSESYRYNVGGAGIADASGISGSSTYSSGTATAAGSELYGGILSSSGAGKLYTTKRKVIQKRSTGPIAIEECDPNENFISIRNNSYTADVDMTGWSVVQVSDHNVSISYYLPSNYVLKARSMVKIFSNSAPVSLSSFENYLIANTIHKWSSANHIQTKVINNDNEEVAYLLEESIV
ncbi:hypothetical protein ACOME3_008945 [Neoechinorhynchus agilis]